MIESIHKIEQQLLEDIEQAEPGHKQEPVDTYRNFLVALSLRKDTGEA